MSILDPVRRTRDIWVYDVARGVRTRLTTDPADENALAWSPDGQRIAFSSRRRSGHDLYVRDASGSGMEELLLEDDLIKYPSGWSRDGRYLTYWTGTGSSPTGNDVGLLELSDRTSTYFAQSPFSEQDARISPDGRWIAYTSNETGQREAYVDAFPARGRRVRISANGADFARWRGDGRELFFVTPDNVMMAASVDGRGDAFLVGDIRRLFAMGERRPAYLGNRDRWYDVTADGRRFIVNTLTAESERVSITLVVNWPALLARSVP